MQVVELAPRVRPAGRFLNRAVLVEGVEAGVGIGLQHAVEVGQVRLRMDALAVGRVGKPHGRRRRCRRWPVVAHIGPQARRSGLAIARRQHRDRRIVGVQLCAGQDVAPNRIDQAGAAARWPRRPSWPAGRDRAPRLRVRKSRTAGTAAGDRRTSPPGRAPASLGRRCRVRWAGSAPAPARWRRSSRTPASGAHGGSRGSWPAHTPAAPPRPRPGGAGRHRRPGRRQCRAHTLSRRAADGRAVACAPTSCAAPGRLPASRAAASASSACRSSSCSSSCSIWWSSFSDLRPNCMRRSLAITSFKMLDLGVRVVVQLRFQAAADRARRVASSNAFRASMSLGRSAALSMRPSLRGLVPRLQGRRGLPGALGPAPVDPFQQHRQLRLASTLPCRCSLAAR